MTKDRAARKAIQYREWADKVEKISKALYAQYQADPRATDMAFWTEPIKIGHHSERKHRNARATLFRKQEKILELDKKAASFREKADNLEHFANTHAGDAERKRQAVRDEKDKTVTVGSEVVDWCFGKGVVLRVNTKTYTIQFDRGTKTTRDKSFIK